MNDSRSSAAHYQKYKVKVKLWEKSFKTQHGRVPSKHDIRDAPLDIRSAYKSYYNLKTAFLEETMKEALDDDGFSLLEMSAMTDEAFNENNCDLNEPQLPFDMEQILRQSNEQQQQQQQSEPTFSNMQQLQIVDIANIANLHEKHVLRSFEPVEQCALNEKAWNHAVAKPTTVNSSSLKTDNKFQRLKLQKVKQFNVRNPRKTLSCTEIPTANANACRTKSSAADELIDFESILLKKSQEQLNAAPIATNELLSSARLIEPVKMHLDEGWLKRSDATDSTFSCGPTAAVKENMPNANTFGLSNVCRAALNAKCLQENKLDVQLDCVVIETPSEKQVNVESDECVAFSDIESDSPRISQLAKRRRIMQSQVSTLSEKAAKAKEENENKSVECVPAIEDQPSEEKSRIRTRNTKTKSKSKSTVTATAAAGKSKRRQSKSVNRKQKASTADMPSMQSEDEEKMPDNEDLKYALALDGARVIHTPRLNAAALQNVDSAAQSYINRLHFDNKPKLAQAKAATEKRDAARKKLEQKIAAGKLNENYVTIDMKHKKYARGKKVFNFSQYKKKQWRHKKRISALTGPNMDMGGCDGGVLTCYACGQVGHFAQQCKVQGDKLLPLTAQLREDPSPFPTLEEAELMAMQNAVMVHSSNISKLPEIANTALYRQLDNEPVTTAAMQPIKTVTNQPTSHHAECSSHADKDPLELSAAEQMQMQSNEEMDLTDIELLTDDEFAAAATKIATPVKEFVGHVVPPDFLQKAGLDLHSLNATTATFGVATTLYDLNSDGSVLGVTKEVKEALRLFGHTDFRKGQDYAVMRILSGLSTLVTLSTGSGKSLCYQLPAYLYSRERKAITLVISPLVSLMEDQVTGVPHFLRAHCLHTNQTPQQKLKVMQLIGKGEVDILLVSPEAVMAGERSTGFGAILRKLPRIAFACIDEVHCVSQWSHNFRPSYLMICKVLRKNLGVHTILGLTATATQPTRRSIIEHLGILDGEKGIVSDVPLPDNLQLSVSKDGQRDKALLQLLNSKRFECCQSIIVYCTRRDECERVAGYLRTCMQDMHTQREVKSKKRKRINWTAEPYHAGMPASRRRTIQNAFMNNELRIVVATIAFGMGINKPDIRAVIHYNMPKNFESYVQEIGRAGRDGKLAHCHLFLDSQGGDMSELQRHIYANSIDRHVIRKLLQRIFVPCSCATNNKRTIAASRICEGHEVAFSKEKAVEALDMPAENIGTLLCYLELESKWGIKLGYDTYVTAKVISYGGAKYLKQAAKECPALAMAIAMEMKKGKFKEDDSIVEFPVVEVASAMGWHSSIVKNRLKNLEWTTVNERAVRTPISVSFFDLGFRITSPGNFTDDEIDDALDTLYQRAVKQEQAQLSQLQHIFRSLSSVAYNNCNCCGSESFTTERSDQLKHIIRDYFRNDNLQNYKYVNEDDGVLDDDIAADVHTLINMYPENNFTGRNIARIFHGISSPNYPAVMWGRCKYWRARTKTDFNRILNLANAIIIQRRC